MSRAGSRERGAAGASFPGIGLHSIPFAPTVAAMRSTFGPLAADLSEAERAKFTAPLVLVHGLWDAPHSWRRFMGYLSHRGWRCIALGWQDSAHRQSLGHTRQSLAAALDELGEAPVLLGHDLGGLLALEVAERSRAAVALAPLIPTATTSLEGAGTWLQRLRGGARSPGRSLADQYPSARPTESIDLLRDVAELGAIAGVDDAGDRPPRLVVAGADDRLAPASAARALAAVCAADFEVVPGGHRLHLDDGWEERAATVHRWLIRSLGEDLLALYDEAWADRE